MEINLDAISKLTQIDATEAVKNTGNDDFKFTLVSHLQESESEGQRIARRKDIRDMKRYRAKIKEFMNEITTHSHTFSRENFLDRKGRHRVYGIIHQVDEDLDKLAEALLSEEKDHLEILRLIDEIRGMLIDILT